MWSYARRVLQGWAAKGWPVVVGTITSSAIEFHQGPVRQGRGYELNTSYSYSVAGTTYNGIRRAFDDLPYVFKVSATSRLGRYVVGAPVLVHYHPSDPPYSVLEPGAEWRTYAALALSIGMFAVGFGALLSFLH